MSSVNEKSIGIVAIPINRKVLIMTTILDVSTYRIAMAAENPIGVFASNGNLASFK